MKGSLPMLTSVASADDSAEGDVVGLHHLPQHAVKDVQCELPPLALVAGTDEGAERHHVGLDCGTAEIVENLESHVPSLTLLAGADQCAQSDDVRRQVHPSHLPQQHEGSVRRLGLFTRADGGVAGDGVRGYPPRLHLGEQGDGALPLAAPRQRAGRGATSADVRRGLSVASRGGGRHAGQEVQGPRPLPSFLAGSDRRPVDEGVRRHSRPRHVIEQNQGSMPKSARSDCTQSGAVTYEVQLASSLPHAIEDVQAPLPAPLLLAGPGRSVVARGTQLDGGQAGLAEQGQGPRPLACILLTSAGHRCEGGVGWLRARLLDFLNCFCVDRDVGLHNFQAHDAY
mmetsp:Transcript_109996/g.350293  ORF Transcript_109996/g.350293 Transcript_109996/m.350293 type:complete len:341 (+) Transcript_109996:1289-2311(+)